MRGLLPLTSFSGVAARRSKEDELSEIWLFSNCSRGQLRIIGRLVDELDVKEGSLLVEQGALGHEFFFILEGTAVVSRNGRKVATLGPGKYFGELALLDRQPRSASVIAETPMRLLVLEQRAFNGLLEEAPAIGRKLLAAMAERIRESDSRAFS